MKLAERMFDLATQGVLVWLQYIPVLDTIRIAVKKDLRLATTELSLSDIQNTDNKDDLLVDAINNAVKKL